MGSMDKDLNPWLQLKMDQVLVQFLDQRFWNLEKKGENKKCICFLIIGLDCQQVGRKWSCMQSKGFAEAPDFPSTISYHLTKRGSVKAEHICQYYVLSGLCMVGNDWEQQVALSHLCRSGPVAKGNWAPKEHYTHTCKCLHDQPATAHQQTLFTIQAKRSISIVNTHSLITNSLLLIEWPALWS